MPTVELGLLRAEVYERPPHAREGPVRAKGMVQLLARGAPAAVVAVLMARDSEAPLAVGFGLADAATGYWNVPVAIANLDLQPGGYRLRQVVLSLGPPIVQEVPVEIIPEGFAAPTVLAVGTREGSVLTEIIYLNTGVGMVDRRYVEVALVQEPTDATSSAPKQPFTLYVSPVFNIPPGVPEAQRPPTPFWGDAPRGFVRGYKLLLEGPALQMFDPLDPTHVDRAARLGTLNDDRRAGRVTQAEYYARVAAIARESNADFLAISTPPLRIDPPPDAPAGSYNGYIFVASNVTYGRDSRRTPPEDEIWGWIAPSVYLDVWRKVPALAAASIVGARWWTE